MAQPQASPARRRLVRLESSPAEDGPVEAMLATDAASRMLGIELVDYGQGWARARMTVRDDMVNGHGICHGGHDLQPGRHRVRLRLQQLGPGHRGGGRDIVFVAPASRGDVLVAEARARARYGRNGSTTSPLPAASRSSPSSAAAATRPAANQAGRCLPLDERRHRHAHGPGEGARFTW